MSDLTVLRASGGATAPAFICKCAPRARVVQGPAHVCRPLPGGDSATAFPAEAGRHFAAPVKIGRVIEHGRFLTFVED